MDSEQDSEAAGPAPTDAGGMLRAAREARRLNLEQVAAETRIPLRHLQSIEAGQFDALPSRTYALGFSRNYARVVGLDEEEIAELVRAELSDEQDRRRTVVGAMEPGDPAKLPSAGLAWVGAVAALIFAIGAIAFFSSYFGAGAGPESLLADADESEAADDKPAPGDNPAATDNAPSASGQVVFTALEDGVWMRVYEEGGERLYEKLMQEGDRFVLPKSASEPRINTALPNLIAVTIDGKQVAKLAKEPTVLDGMPVSAKALLARDNESAATDGSAPSAN
jgi:cytoskeletal protein RodZ